MIITGQVVMNIGAWKGHDSDMILGCPSMMACSTGGLVVLFNHLKKINDYHWSSTLVHGRGMI